MYRDTARQWNFASRDESTVLLICSGKSERTARSLPRLAVTADNFIEYLVLYRDRLVFERSRLTSTVYVCFSLLNFFVFITFYFLVSSFMEVCGSHCFDHNYIFHSGIEEFEASAVLCC